MASPQRPSSDGTGRRRSRSRGRDSHRNSRRRGPSDSNDSEHREDIENQQLKRKIDALELIVAEKNIKKKKGEAFLSIGRGIGKVASLFVKVSVLVQAYYLWDPDQEESSDENEGGELLSDKEKSERQIKQLEKRARNRNLQGFQLVANLVPGFGRMVTDENKDPDTLMTMSKQLWAGAKNARGDDISRMKRQVAAFLNFRPLGQKADPLLNPETRIHRGFNHNLTGKLICPIHLNWSDPVTRESIRNKSIRTNDSFFIRAFYWNEEGDIRDVEHGFLKGVLLVQTWREIFMHNGAIDDTGDFASDEDGNASVPAPQRKKAKRSTRKCIADILNMTQVTARSIAYCAVMLRFALSPVEIWGKDESFNYEGLYNTILDYFECPEPGSVGADHANDLLKWWNVQVFNTEDESRNLKPIFNFENTINAQRAAKQASTAAAATGPSAIQPTPTAAS